MREKGKLFSLASLSLTKILKTKISTGFNAFKLPVWEEENEDEVTTMVDWIVLSHNSQCNNKGYQHDLNQSECQTSYLCL